MDTVYKWSCNRKGNDDYIKIYVIITTNQKIFINHSKNI